MSILFTILVYVFYVLITLIYEHLQMMGQILLLVGVYSEEYLSFLFSVENFVKKCIMTMIFSGVYIFLLILADILA